MKRPTSNEVPQSSQSVAQATKALGTTLAGRLHLRSDLHIARKIWHMGMGLLLVSIYLLSGMERGTGVVILGTILAFDLLMETVRLRNPAVNEAVVKIMGPFMRSCEVNRLSGVPYYLSAAILSIGIFPQPIAVLSILYLAFGDPIASLFGILYGDKSIRLASGKSLIGTSAGVLTCMFVTFAYLQSMAITEGQRLFLIVLGGIAGGTAELLPLDVDDNFSIPIVSGFVLWLAFILMGI